MGALMIETTYVRLARAAEMLQTDGDTLLVAAGEGRIQLYGLLNRWLNAEMLEWDNDRVGHAVGHAVDYKMGWFWMVPLDRRGAFCLLQGDDARVEALSEVDDKGRVWTQLYAMEKEPMTIRLDHVFLKRAEVEGICSMGRVPAAGTVRDPGGAVRKSSETLSRDTLLCIIAALADQAGIDPNERGAAARIEEWTEHIGTPISDDTIRGVLKQIPDAIERRGKSK